MVQIFVNDSDSSVVCIAYELDLVDPVRKLKADIEETEGVPVGRQSLRYLDTELRDEKDLESYSIDEGCIVDLDAPISDLFDTLIEENASLRNINFEWFNFKDYHLKTDDIVGRTLSVFGIQHNDSVTLSSEHQFFSGSINSDDSYNEDVMVDSGSDYNGGVMVGLMEDFGRDYTEDGDVIEDLEWSDGIYTALYDWDGDMKHPGIKGLPLKQGMSVIVTGQDNPDWYCGHAKGQNVTRYIPSQYISDSSSPYVSRGQIPSLPPFKFPKASPLEFKYSLGEKGHSFIKITLTYNEVAPPGKSTPINVSLKCLAAGGRRILSFSLKITSPGQAANDVQPHHKWLGPILSTNIQTTDQRTTEYHTGAGFQAGALPAAIQAEGGASTEIEREMVQSGTRTSRTGMAGHEDGDTAIWVLHGADTLNGVDGLLSVDEAMSFLLKEKPQSFLYDCFVTTIKDGKKRECRGVSRFLLRLRSW